MAINKQAHLCDPVQVDPLCQGRRLKDGVLEPVMMGIDPKPSVVRQTKYCGCSKSYCLRNCVCARSNVKCVIACRCAADRMICRRAYVDSDEN